MRRKPFVLLFGLLILVACGRKTSTGSSASSSIAPAPSSQVTADGSTPSTSSSSAISQTPSAMTETPSSTVTEGNPEAPVTAVAANGAYHSVQGKYGEVIIVNKKHPLAPDYAPGEDATAGAAFRQLLAGMRAAGFAVSDHYSGFRSYDLQANLYQNYVNQDGQAAADRYSARPGHSEHQTGLAFDVLDASGQLLEEPVASQWLAENAHHYGFVVRYLPGKEHITGYMPESWHVRYIGQEATDIYQSGLTLEEYYGVAGGSY